MLSVDTNWRSTLCVPRGSASGREIARNAITGQSFPALPIFRRFTPWRGRQRSEEGLLVDFLNFTIPERLYCNPAYMGARKITETHAIRTRQCGLRAFVLRANAGAAEL
jgi:hypothetical protein